MFREQLLQIGLTPKEAHIYEIFLEIGKAGIGPILKKTPYKRGDTYNIIYSLIQKGLISEIQEKNKKIFILENPDTFNKLIDKQEKQIQHNKNILSQILPEFKIHYNTIFDKPGVQYLTGLVGFKKVYDDIYKTKCDVRIFTSTQDRSLPGMSQIISQGIFEQHLIGIKARGFASLNRGHTKNSINKIKEYGVELHIVDDELILLPSQIMIYGNKAAIISLKDEIIVTIIENKNVSQTLKNIFDLLWKLTTPIHQQLYQSLPDDTYPGMQHTGIIEDLEKLKQKTK